MTQTKLEIIGPYTPEHEGPFCTRDGSPVRVLCSDMKNEYSIVAIVLEEDGKETVSTFLKGGRFCRSGVDEGRNLMNAREVPVAREFWVNEYAGGGLSLAHPSLGRAAANRRTDGSFIRTIHLREVLPGDE